MVPALDPREREREGGLGARRRGMEPLEEAFFPVKQVPVLPTLLPVLLRPSASLPWGRAPPSVERLSHSTVSSRSERVISSDFSCAARGQ